MPEVEKKVETKEAQSPHKTPFGKGSALNFSAWQFSWELGYTIAIPIVFFALLGRWGDRQMDTSPWLLLAGVLVSIIISSTIVYKKVSRILH